MWGRRGCRTNGEVGGKAGAEVSRGKSPSLQALVNSTLEKLGDEEVKAQGLRVGRVEQTTGQFPAWSLRSPHVVMFMVIEQNFH